MTPASSPLRSPLERKKKLRLALRWAFGKEVFVGGAVVALAIALFAANRSKGLGRDPAREASERQAIAQQLAKVTRLHKYAESFQLQADGASAIPVAALPTGLDVEAVGKQAGKLDDAFRAEALHAALDIMHARHVPVEELKEMSGKLRAEIGNPDYLINIDTEGMRECQNSIMSAKGFTPTVESARQIASCVTAAESRHEATFALVFVGIPILFTFGNAARTGLDKSIKRAEATAGVAAQAAVSLSPLPSMPIVTHTDIKISKPLRLKTKGAN